MNPMLQRIASNSDEVKQKKISDAIRWASKHSITRSLNHFLFVTLFCLFYFTNWFVCFLLLVRRKKNRTEGSIIGIVALPTVHVITYSPSILFMQASI